MILGIDEVGRGPWAGPLVVGAVVLGEHNIGGLTDSKKLTKKRREELDVLIREQASGFGLGWVGAEEIDEIGLSEALKLATRRAVEQIKVPYSEIIIDGTVNFLTDTGKGKYVTTMKKADLLIASVSAASIIAKVARDDYMARQDSIYPGYGFSSHVGYGTLKHIQAIKKLGVTPLHRLSFAPLIQYRDSPSGFVHGQDGFSPGSTGAPAPGRTRVADVLTHEEPRPDSKDHTTKQAGDKAESLVAEYLVNKGHEILERNWKTKFCEIDIVSSFRGRIYFTEVKYRRESKWGDGLDAITKKKQRQMKFAAELYVLKAKFQESDMRLVAVAVSLEPPVVEKYLEIE